MDLFTLVASLTLDSSKYEKGLDDSERRASSFGDKVKTGLSTAAKVGVAALAATTTAAVAFGKSAVDVGRNFDSSMSQVAATMGFTVEELNTAGSVAAETYNQLRDFAQQMGSETVFSASQAADALNYMALAGYDAQTAMQMLPNVLNLAAAGSIDLARASDMVTDAQSALGLTLDETSQLVDKMAKASSKSNTSVEQLGEAMLTVGGTAKNLSGGTTELATVLGILADNGIKGAEGGTALRNMLNSLSAPTDKAAKLLDNLGVQVFDAEGNMRSLNDVFGDLGVAMDGMTQEERMNVISTVFNARDMKAAEAMLANVGDRYNELSGYIEDSAGAAEAMAAVQLDNLEGDITLFKSAMEGAQIVLSDQLSPTLREFVQFGSSAVSELSTAFKEGGLTGALDAMSNIMTEGLNLIISKLPSFIEAGVGILMAIVDGLINNLPTIVDAAIQIATMLMDTLIENLPKMVDAALELIVALANGLIEALPQLIPALVDVIMTIVEKLTEPDTIVLLINVALQLLLALAEGLIRAIPRLISAIPTIIMNLVSALVRSAPQIAAAGVQLIGALVRGIISSVSAVIGAAGQIVSKIREAISGVVSSALNWGKDLINNFIGGIKQKASNLWSEVKNIAGGIKSFLGFSEPEKGPLSNFHTYAPDMMALFAKGIRDSEHVVTDQISKSFDFSDVIGKDDLTVQRNVTNKGTRQINGLTINVYPTPDMDEDDLVEKMMVRIQEETEKEEASVS